MHPGSVTNQLHPWVGNTLAVPHRGCKIKTLKLLQVVIMRINWVVKPPAHNRHPINVNLLPPFPILDTQPSGILLGPKVLANEIIGVFSADRLSMVGTLQILCSL